MSLREGWKFNLSMKSVAIVAVSHWNQKVPALRYLPLQHRLSPNTLNRTLITKSNCASRTQHLCHKESSHWLQQTSLRALLFCFSTVSLSCCGFNPELKDTLCWTDFPSKTVRFVLTEGLNSEINTSFFENKNHSGMKSDLRPPNKALRLKFRRCRSRGALIQQNYIVIMTS